MEVRLEAEVTVRLRPALMHARARDRRRPDARGSCFLRAVAALAHRPVRKPSHGRACIASTRRLLQDGGAAERTAGCEWLPKPYTDSTASRGPQSEPGPRTRAVRRGRPGHVRAVRRRGMRSVARPLPDVRRGGTARRRWRVVVGCDRARALCSRRIRARPRARREQQPPSRRDVFGYHVRAKRGHVLLLVLDVAGRLRAAPHLVESDVIVRVHLRSPLGLSLQFLPSMRLQYTVTEWVSATRALSREASGGVLRELPLGSHSHQRM